MKPQGACFLSAAFRCRRCCIWMAGLLGWGSSALWASEPTIPLTPPLFSLDAASPTVTTSAAIDETEVLMAPGPTVAIDETALGLTGGVDELDGISNARSEPPIVTFTLLFSVDPASIGSVFPDPVLVAMGVPYNVADQAARGQAPADVFMSTRVYTRSGTTFAPGASLVDTLSASDDNNVLVTNQFNEGGDSLTLDPEVAASVYTTDERDNVDAMKEDVAAFSGGGVPVYFSLTSGSTSLDTLCGGQGTDSGANIFLFDPNQASTTCFGSFTDLGLLQPDDIDAVVVFDTAVVGVYDGTDQILFSLAPGSLTGAPGLVFTVSFGGSPTIFATPDQLGLDPSDNIDALELFVVPGAMLAETATASALAHGIRRTPGDCNNDGAADVDDYGGTGCDQGFFACLGGPGLPYDDGTDSQPVSPVSISNPEFAPNWAPIELGDSIQWIWGFPMAPTGPHNVVSGRPDRPDGNFRLGAMPQPGGNFTKPFSDLFLAEHPMPADVYPYFCGGHEDQAFVVVQPHPCAVFDLDTDGDVDLFDYGDFLTESRRMPVIDGHYDNAYGAPLAIQDTPTGFGDADLGLIDFTDGSELDAAYATFDVSGLYLFLVGNLESNYNKLEIFFDSVNGGQNRLRGDNPNVDFDGLNRMGNNGAGNGLTFDPEFSADFWIGLTGGDGGGGSYALFANHAETLTSGGGTGRYLGSTTAGSDGTLTGGDNPDGIQVTIDNRNTGGVDVVAVNEPASVQTGMEMFIPWSALGGIDLGPLRICAFVNGANHDFVSNQVLKPIGGDKNLGEPRNVDFGAIPEPQYFVVDVGRRAPVTRLKLSFGLRETGSTGALGSNGGTTGDIEWIDLDAKTLILDNTWRQYTWVVDNATVTPFTRFADGVLDGDGGTLEHLRIAADGSSGPFAIWIDDLGMTAQFPPEVFEVDFEGFTEGQEVLFRQPDFSGSTFDHLGAGSSTGITNAESFAGSGSLRIDFEFVDAAPERWVRMTTFNAPVYPNPTVPFGRNAVITLQMKGVE